MKKNLINSIKPILSDRLVVVLIFVFIILCVLYGVYVGVSLRPSDLQVAVHYTAFGDTSFYREKWYYLITFIIFGLLLAVSHTAITIKLYVQGRRQIAISFILLSVLLLVIAWFIAWSVLKVAFL
jgi:hypothetical protein